MDRRKSLLPYRIVEKDAVAHVEVGTAEGIHACPRRRRAYHRVEGVVGVGDRGAAKMGIEQSTPPPPGTLSPTMLLLVNEQWSMVAPVVP